MGCTGSKTAATPKPEGKKGASATLLQEPVAASKVAKADKPNVFQCMPCDTDLPTTDLGTAKEWINKAEDGRQFTRIRLEPGFDWKAQVKPLLPGCPDWCPATHFGYLESGSMGIKMQDGAEYTINAGETYFVPPGHLPVIQEPTVMIEFSFAKVLLLFFETFVLPVVDINYRPLF